jgi:hypothetical protein
MTIDKKNPVPPPQSAMPASRGGKCPYSLPDRAALAEASLIPDELGLFSLFVSRWKLDRENRS